MDLILSNSDTHPLLFNSPLMWKIKFVRPVMMDSNLCQTSELDADIPDPNLIIPLNEIQHIVRPSSNVSLNDLYMYGISPQEFRLIRQGNPNILKRQDGRIWSTYTVEKLITKTIILTNGVKNYKLGHFTRAPWETSLKEVSEDLHLFTLQQNHEHQHNLLDNFSLSYSAYK